MALSELLFLFQLLWITPLIAASWKDLKDRECWKILATALIWSSLLVQFLIGSEIWFYALLSGPAAAWVFEYFRLWKPFDSKMLIGLTLLHADLWALVPILTLLVYSAWTISWKKARQTHAPVLPVFLALHLFLIIL